MLFFRYFKDGEAEYIARTWLLDPVETEARTKRTRSKRTREPWNGRDFYVSFGASEHRSWEDARQYGFISGGGDPWYSRTLNHLEPGHRVFVNIPQTGYVGVGIVTESAHPVKELTVDVDGKQTPILELPLRADMTRDADDPEKCEYLVRVRWLETVDPSEAYWQTGMFANQNTACRLTNRFTLERLYQRFNVSEEDEVVVEGKAEISSEPPAQVVPAASPSAPSAPVS